MIDAHQHFWEIGRNGQDWPGHDLPAIRRDAFVEELEAIARPLGVTGCIAVQSQPNGHDTEFLLRLAAANPFVLGVVGWIDLIENGAERLAALSRIGPLRGVRPMLQSLPDDDWIAEAPVDSAVQAMVERNIVFDALVQTRHLTGLCRFVDRWPTLQIVVDHAAKPPIGHDLHLWRQGLSHLAQRPNVHCKLSGLATEFSTGLSLDAANSVLADLMEMFGPSRLLWGSDWPVLNLASDYATWLQYCRRQLPETSSQAVFHDNALGLYGQERIDSAARNSTCR